MANKLSTLIKGIGYLWLLIYTMIQSYIIGLIFSGVPTMLVMAVWSIIKPLPEVILDKMWAVYLVCGAPFGVAVFIFISIDVIKTQLKKNNKQDN